MLNPLKFLSKIIKSSNQKELDRLNKITKKVNDLEDQITKLEDISKNTENNTLKSTLVDEIDSKKVFAKILESENTSATTPCPICLYNLLPSVDTIPAPSCPRCCCAYSPIYANIAASELF